MEQPTSCKINSLPVVLRLTQLKRHAGCIEVNWVAVEQPGNCVKGILTATELVCSTQ